MRHAHHAPRPQGRAGSHEDLLLAESLLLQPADGQGPGGGEQQGGGGEPGLDQPGQQAALPAEYNNHCEALADI